MGPLTSEVASPLICLRNFQPLNGSINRCVGPKVTHLTKRQPRYSSMGHHQNVPQTKTHCCLDCESFNAFHLVMQAAQRKQERPSRRQTFYLCSASSSNGSGLRSAPSTAEQHRRHTYDVVTLGNLCVDIFIHVDQVGCAADTPPYLVRQVGCNPWPRCDSAAAMCRPLQCNLVYSGHQCAAVQD